MEQSPKHNNQAGDARPSEAPNNPNTTSFFIDPDYTYIHYVHSIPLYPNGSGSVARLQHEVLPVDFGTALQDEPSMGITYQPLIHTSFQTSDPCTFPLWALDFNSSPWTPLDSLPISDNVPASSSQPFVQAPSVDHLNFPNVTELRPAGTAHNDGGPSFFEPLNDINPISWHFDIAQELFEVPNFDSQSRSGSSQESLGWNPCPFEESIQMEDNFSTSGISASFYTPMAQSLPGLDNLSQAITYEDQLPSGSSDSEVSQVPHPGANLQQASSVPLPLPPNPSPRSLGLLINPGYPCSHVTCSKSFTRDADRLRHENQVHRSQPGLHVCPIIGCPKSQGRGYSRADKVVEHLWKKHGDLGFVKG